MEKNEAEEGKEGMCQGQQVPRRETIHNQHRRSFWHDYYQKGLYMVTMVVEGRKRLFGTIVGHANGRPGTDEAPHVALSELGRRVLEQEVSKIHRFYPMVEVWRVAMMPDHIHLLLRVNGPMPEGKHLGMVVRGFKTGCSRAWWQWQDEVAVGLQDRMFAGVVAVAGRGGSGAWRRSAKHGGEQRRNAKHDGEQRRNAKHGGEQRRSAKHGSNADCDGCCTRGFSHGEGGDAPRAFRAGLP